MARIIQITDTHLYADPEQHFGELHESLTQVKPYHRLAEVLSHIKSTKVLPDLLLLTGDLSQDISLASYQHLGKLIGELNLPTYFIPGNHDDAECIKIMLENPVINASRIIFLGNWAIILLDSTMPERISGWLRSEELNFLQDCLQKTLNYQVMIALHHHPLPVGSHYIDKYILENREDFLQIISSYSQVKLVIFGHVHQEYSEVLNGIHFLSSPASSVQFLPNSDPFAIDYTKSSGYRWLELLDDGFKTKVIRI